MDPINLIGIIVGITGLGYAIYQGSERKKLIKLARAQAWFLCAKANNFTGIVQRAYKEYMTKYNTNPDTELLSLLSQCNAYGQEMYRESIRQIQFTEPEFNFGTIDLWVKQGKVDPDHKPLFIVLVVEDKDDNTNSINVPPSGSTSH